MKPVYQNRQLKLHFREFRVCTLTLSGNALIKDNSASDHSALGGGVYVGNGIFTMSGGATVTLSTGENADKPCQNDVYLENGKKITIPAALTGTAPVARITVADSQYLTTRQVLEAGTGVTLKNETYKFAVTPQTSPAQQWTVGGNGCLKQGKYTEVPYGQLEAYLANASATEVNYIEVTGISPADLTGTYGFPPDTGPLGQKIKNNPSKEVALKLPSDLSVTDMNSCFAHCTNLVSLENLPSGVENMQACFYDCTSLTTAPDIPATVTRMKECFRFCTALQGVKINRSYAGCDFYSTFNGCTALQNGGIKVPSGDLGTYQTNAGTMGTTADKFSAIP